MLKLKWQVQPEPTGRYRSFEQRGWPTAELADGTVVAHLRCNDAYAPSRARNGDHAELSVHVYNFNPTAEQRQKHGSRVPLTLKARAQTLPRAKELVLAFYSAHPEMLPK